MEKPQKHTRSIYNYSECNDYIEKKYGIKTRDYAGYFGEDFGKREVDPPYQDFWHWIIISRGEGDIIVLSEDLIEAGEEEFWYAKILKLFLNEFGEKNSEGVLEAEFDISW